MMSTGLGILVCIISEAGKQIFIDIFVMKTLLLERCIFLVSEPVRLVQVEK